MPPCRRAKRFAAILRNAEFPPARDVHGQVNGCLTGLLQIEDNGIQFDLIGDEVLPVSRIFFLDASKTTFDAGRFIHNYIISHTSARFL